MIKYKYCALFLIAVFISGGCGKEEKEKKEVIRPVKMMTVSRNSHADYRKYPATVRASKRVKLAFQVSGPLIELPISPGDQVKKDQLLAKIDPRDFKSDRDSALAKFNDAKSEFERYATLIKKDAVSKSAYEKVKKEYQVAGSNLKIAQKAFKDTELKAPFMGIVAEKYVENFQNVRAKEPILSLQDISKLEIVADIPEADMAKGKKLKDPKDVDKYLQAKVEFPAFADKYFPLKAKEFNAQADSVTQTFKVVFVMDNPDNYRILPGMTAVLKMRENFFDPKMDSNNLFYAPSNSVFEGNDNKQYVWIVNSNMTVSKKEVKTGSLKGSDIEVLNGLKEGDKIITAGVSKLHDGMKVRELKNIGGKKLK